MNHLNIVKNLNLYLNWNVGNKTNYIIFIINNVFLFIATSIQFEHIFSSTKPVYKKLVRLEEMANLWLIQNTHNCMVRQRNSKRNRYQF